MSKKSAAAATSALVCNIYMFNRIYVKVEPLMRKLKQRRSQRQKPWRR